MNALEVVDAVDRLDAVALVAGLERQPVDELHEAGHGLVARQVGDVHALDHAGCFLQAEHLFQAREPLLGIDEKHLGLHVLLEVAPLVERFQEPDLVAEPRRLLEGERRRCREHVRAHLLEEPLLAPFEERLQPIDVLAILLLRDAQVARGGALADRRQQAGAEPAPLFVVGVDVERAGAKLEDPLQHHDRSAQAPGTRERAVELHPFAPRRACELDPGEILVGRDLQIRKRLVVLEIAVESGLNVLDEPAFEEEGVDLAFGLEEVDVANLAHEVGSAAILLGRLEEVAAGPGAEVLRLAHVDHAAGRILHQVHTRRRGKRPHLLGGERAVTGRRGRVGVGGCRFGAVERARFHAPIVEATRRRALADPAPGHRAGPSTPASWPPAHPAHRARLP